MGALDHSAEAIERNRQIILSERINPIPHDMDMVSSVCRVCGMTLLTIDGMKQYDCPGPPAHKRPFPEVSTGGQNSVVMEVQQTCTNCGYKAGHTTYRYGQCPSCGYMNKEFGKPEKTAVLFPDGEWVFTADEGKNHEDAIFPTWPAKLSVQCDARKEFDFAIRLLSQIRAQVTEEGGINDLMVSLDFCGSIKRLGEEPR